MKINFSDKINKHAMVATFDSEFGTALYAYLPLVDFESVALIQVLASPDVHSATIDYSRVYGSKIPGVNVYAIFVQINEDLNTSRMVRVDVVAHNITRRGLK